MLNMVGLCYLFQAGLKPLLLFKHLGVILENVGGNREKHDNIEERQKNFLFCLCIVDLGTIMGFFG